MSQGWKAGRWSAICDVCGFRFKSDVMIDRWDGLKVDPGCWETRHPQDFVRVKPEKTSPIWTRPEQPDEFVNICYLWEDSSYADLATADCASADSTAYTYAFLLDLKGSS